MPAVNNHRPSAPAKVPRAASPVAHGTRGAPSSRGRPSWSGLLRLSLVSVPVKAYPAVTGTATSPFHLLHASCGQRIRYAKNCPQHGAVESDAIVRGFEYAPDQFVVIEAEELNRLRPVKDRALILEQFLPVQEVAPTFFAGRSLYLYPDGPAAQHPYSVLVEALRQAGQGALGRVVLSNQRQLVLVRASSRLLVLDVLHYPSQVRNVDSWEADLPASAATDSERQLAEQLIALASGPVDWERYRDTSAEELAALVEAKRARQPAPIPSEEPTVLRLLDALKQSVAAARQGSESSAIKARKPRARRVTA
jgi:DNA end-binding protein Ku